MFFHIIHIINSHVPVLVICLFLSGTLNVPSGIKTLWYGFVSLLTEYILNVQSLISQFPQ